MGEAVFPIYGKAHRATTPIVVFVASLEDLLARRLRELADERGIPLSHVADRCGMSRSHLWRLLKVESSATLEAVQRIADVFGVSPCSLICAGHVTDASEGKPAPTPTPTNASVKAAPPPVYASGKPAPAKVTANARGRSRPGTKA